MIEYLPQILGLLLILAFIRIFWSTLFKLASNNEKYEAERRRIQRRKKELGIEDEPEKIEEPEGAEFLKGTLEIVVGFIFGLLALTIGSYAYKYLL